MKHLRLFLLGCLAILTAQAEPPPTIPTYFYAFDYVPGRDAIHVPTGPETHQTLQLSKANIVGPVNVTLQNGALPLYDKAVTAEGKTTRSLLANATFSANLKTALVVLFPAGKDDKLPYRAIVLNHNLQDFPMGVYRMINISPHAVRGAIGKTIIQAKPGGIGNLKPEGEPGAIVAARFEFYADERWNLLTETRCAVRDDRRWLTCIYQDPASGRMNIRSIPDRTIIPAPAAEPTP
jgi:hypothetical protein